MRIRRRQPSARRRGVVLMVELLLVFPVMLVFLFAIVQFYMLVTVREELLAASRTAARVAAAGDRRDKKAVESEVKKSVRRAFGTGRLADAEVKITWADELDPKDAGGETDWVQVTLTVPLRRVVPDVLGLIGFSLGSQELVVGTTNRVE